MEFNIKLNLDKEAGSPRAKSAAKSLPKILLREAGNIPANASFVNSYFPLDLEGNEYDRYQMPRTSFVGLLSHCYNEHLNLTISPYDIWNIILSELSQEVINNSKLYQKLFTDSDEKKLLTVVGYSDPTLMPMAALTSLLNANIKFDGTLLFPAFSVVDEMAKEMSQAIFCDMASPYYEYAMTRCGIRQIKVLGLQSDWIKMKNNLHELTNIFTKANPKLHQYFVKAYAVLTQICDNWVSPDIDWWKKIYTDKDGMSGSDLRVNGWITDLIINPVKELKDAITKFAKVTYKNLDTQKTYTAFYGGFDYRVDHEAFCQLNYSKHVYQVDSQ